MFQDIYYITFLFIIFMPSVPLRLFFNVVFFYEN